MTSFVGTVFASKRGPARWKLFVVSLLAVCACLLPSFASVAQAKPLNQGPALTSPFWAGVVAKFVNSATNPPTKFPKILTATWTAACPNHTGIFNSIIRADFGSTLIQGISMGANLNTFGPPIGVGTIVTDTSTFNSNQSGINLSSTAVPYLQNGSSQFIFPANDTVNCGDPMSGTISAPPGSGVVTVTLADNRTKNPWTLPATSFQATIDASQPQCLVGRNGGDLMPFGSTTFGTCTVRDNSNAKSAGIDDCPDGSIAGFTFPTDCSTWQFVTMQKPGEVAMATVSASMTFGKVGLVSNGSFSLIWNQFN